jgi:predicted metal-dependent hydrolase
MNETLEIGGLAFHVRRSTRRKSLGLTVDRDGDLVVHVPNATATDDVERWTRQKLLWVHGKLAQRKAIAPRVRVSEFVSGEPFYYLGRNFSLKLVLDQKEPLRFDGKHFYLCRDSRSSAAVHFRKWYIDTGTPWLQGRVTMYSRRTVANAARIKVGNLGFRWASCGKYDTLFFNWKTLQLPVRLIDYVVMHELVHLREPHHTINFWRTLEAALPDFRERQYELLIKAREFPSWE